MQRSEMAAALQRYLRQRIASGETEALLPGGPLRDEAAGVERFATRSASAALDATGATPRPAARLDTSAVVELASAPSGDDSLERVAAEVSACTRCRLHATRHKAVPGVGPADADLVFVGEGPGAEEDAQGKPFVGAAGQLLTKIIQSVQLQREEVFITNIVKCRPPGNRDPEPDEIAACEPYLKRQLQLLQPKVICALGRHAGAVLTGAPATMGQLRTGERYYEGIRLFPTYHPAALLRNPQWKRPVWEDIQKVREEYDRRREKS